MSKLYGGPFIYLITILSLLKYLANSYVNINPPTDRPFETI